MQTQTTNPLASIADDLPPAPAVVLLPQPNETPIQRRARLAANRETLLRQQGYTIAPDGGEKVLKVNRDWIAQGGDQGQWLLFLAGSAPIKAREVIFLDEVTTEQEVIDVQTQKQEKYGCGTRTVTETKQVRSAYMISEGRVAYRG